MNEHIREVMPAPMVEAVQRLGTIPGSDKRVAQTIVAETGPDLAPFATAPQLASWAGLSGLAAAPSDSSAVSSSSCETPSMELAFSLVEEWKERHHVHECRRDTVYLDDCIDDRGQRDCLRIT